jgi:hypothetical protein
VSLGWETHHIADRPDDLTAFSDSLEPVISMRICTLTHESTLEIAYAVGRSLINRTVQQQ